MNHCGFLSPEAVLYACTTYDHLNTAMKICEKLGRKFNNGVEAEDYLMDAGWVVVRARDIYGRIGYPQLSDERKLVYLTDEQVSWLTEHYAEWPQDKQQSVDYMLDHLNRR